MTAYDFAELFHNTAGRRGEIELRAYVANGGDINEADRDGTTAMYIALHPSCSEGRAAAPRLLALVRDLGGK